MFENKQIFSVLGGASLQNVEVCSDFNFDNKLINYKVPKSLRIFERIRTRCVGFCKIFKLANFVANYLSSKWGIRGGVTNL